MLADYTRIIELLKRCKTNEVTQAERQLKQLQVGQLQVLSCLQQSLRDQTLQTHIHILATSKINQIFVSDTSIQPQAFCMKYFTTLLTDPSISMQNKKSLRRALMYCIQRCDQQYLEMWKQLTQNTLVNQNMFEIGLLLLCAFSCAQIKKNMIFQLDQKPFQFTISLLCNKYLNLQNNQSIYFVKLVTSTLQSWKQIVQYLIHYSSIFSIQLLTKFASSQTLCRCLSFVYTNFSNGNQHHFLYLADQQPQNTQLINQMKKIALELHLLILNFNLKQHSHTALFLFTITQISMYINTLCYLSMQRNLFYQYELQDLVIAMLRILKYMSLDSPCILSKSWKQMIHFVLLPFVYANDQEIQDFQDNTNSFIQISQDCCEKQKMGILKTEAVSFLQKITQISNKIQQCNQQMIPFDSITQRRKQNQSLIAKYIINFSIASIKHHLNMQFIKNNEFLEEQGLPQQIQPIPIQTAFLILSVYSYSLCNYQKQLETLKIILCNDQVWKLPPLERARIYSFLAYNYKQILGSTQNQTMKYLIDVAFSEENHLTTTYCALEFISNVIHHVYSQKNMERIIKRIVLNRCNNFWMLIRKIVHIFCSKFSQNLLILLVVQVYKRIQREIEHMAGQQVKAMHVITNLLSLIRSLCQKSQLLSQKHQLKALLWQSHRLFPIALSNYFEEDVIKIINCFLFYASTEEIENHSLHKFVNEFIREFQKSDFKPTYFYIAFNDFVIKGAFESTVKPIYQVIKKGLIYLLNEKDNQCPYSQIKLPIGHSLLILQNMLALHGAEFSQDELQFLSTSVECLYPQPVPVHTPTKSTHNLIIYDRTLLARALNVQFLCHMYFPNPGTLTTLTKCIDLNIYYGYDVSVLVSCIKIQMSKTKQLGNFVQLLLIMVRVVYSYIVMDEKYRELQAKELEKKKRKYQDYKMSEQQDEDFHIKKAKQDLIIRIKKTIDYQVILAMTNTPFLKNQRKLLGYLKCIKEVKQIRVEFIAKLVSLRQTDTALFQSILTGFDQNTKQQLKIITECQFDDIISGNMISMGGRKKFKILRVRQGNGGELARDGLEEEDGITERRHELRFTQDGDSDDEIKMMKYQKAEKKGKQKGGIGE